MEAWSARVGDDIATLQRADSHEASSAGDHDVLHIRPGLEFGGSCEDRRLFPDVDILHVEVTVNQA